MNKMNKDIISVSEFAERMHVSGRCIRDAISLGKLKTCVVSVEGYTKPKIDFDVGKKEFEQIGIGLKKKLQPVESDSMNEVNELDVCDISIKSSMIEATRLQAIYKARVLALESGILAGKYVLKSDVYDELFRFGVELKAALLAIPGRITDTLISISTNRNQFHSLLSKSIEDELVRLSKYNQKV